MLFLNLGASLALLLVLTSLVSPVSYPPGSHAYMEQQALALRPGFRADLEMLADAPRYTIEAAVHPEIGRVTGQMVLRYTNTSGMTLSELVFRLYPNARTIYGGGNLTVESVAQGETALDTDLSEDATVLRVQLQRPLKPGQTVSMDLTFSAQVPAGTRQGYGIFNQDLGVLSLSGWYPQLAIFDDGWYTAPIPVTGDAMLAETSLYDVTLTVPEGLRVVSTGTMLGRESHGPAVTWHLVSGPAREFTVAISDRLEMLETQVGEVTLRLHTLPAEEPTVSEEDAQLILSSVFETYVNRFGPYPFVEFDLVEANIPIDGYEFSGMVYVDHAVRAQETLADYQYAVAHEVAHQWWYGLVGNHTVKEPWLDESLAAYSSILFLENTQGPSAGKELLNHWASMEGLRQPEDPPINSSTLEFSSWAPYHKTVYTHGAFFLDQLRVEMGDQKFSELLRQHLARYRYRTATTADFLDLAETVAGRDLSPIFGEWFDIDQAYGQETMPRSERTHSQVLPRGPVE